MTRARLRRVARLHAGKAGGRPARITLLEELIKYVLGHSRVWLARRDEVADAVRPALRASA